MSTIKKPCLYCGDSCDGKPRVKNATGQYAHKHCFDTHNQPATPHAPATTVTAAAITPADPLEHDDLGLGFPDDDLEIGFADDDAMGGFLDDIPTQAPPQSNILPCPTCGNAVAPDDILCTSCGTNVKSGKKSKLKVSKERDTSGAALGVVNAIPLPLRWAAGLLIGGLFGTVLWVLLATTLGFSHAAMALIVAAGASGGILLFGLGQTAGIWTGLPAAIVTIIGAITANVTITIVDVVEAVTEDASLSIRSYQEPTITELKQYQAEHEALRLYNDGNFIYSDTLDNMFWGLEWPDNYPEQLVAQINNDWIMQAPAALESAKMGLRAEAERQRRIAADEMTPEDVRFGDVLQHVADQIESEKFEQNPDSFTFSFGYSPELLDQARERWRSYSDDQKNDSKQDIIANHQFAAQIAAAARNLSDSFANGSSGSRWSRKLKWILYCLAVSLAYTFGGKDFTGD